MQVRSWNKTKHMWEHPHGQWPPCLTATLSTLRSRNGPSHATSAASSGSLNHFSQFYPLLFIWTDILKFCWKQQNVCCLPLLHQSITTCVHLPKDTATSVQVILLCHVNGNNIWGSITCRKFLDNLNKQQLLINSDPLIHLWEPWTLTEHTISKFNLHTEQHCKLPVLYRMRLHKVGQK